MKTSVIVSTYNRPDALLRVLEALDIQSVAPDEVIVADDGSGQSTRECVEALGQRLTVPIVHVWHPDEGFRLALIRNKAILVAKFDYIIFLDGDCIPDPHFIEDHCRLARRGFFVQGKRVLVDQQWSPRFTHHYLQKGRLRLMFSPHLSNTHHLIRMTRWPALRRRGLSGIRGCNIALWKKDIQSVNGFNTAFRGWGREDSELVVRLYNYGLKRREHPFGAICFHLWHPEQNRKDLSINDDLLAQARTSPVFRCAQGLAEVDEPPILSVFYARETEP